MWRLYKARKAFGRSSIRISKIDYIQTTNLVGYFFKTGLLYLADTAMSHYADVSHSPMQTGKPRKNIL